MAEFVVSGAFSTTLRVEAAGKKTTKTTAINATTKAALKTAFDADYYASKYPDIKAAYGTDKEAMFNHFLNYGMKEGRMMNAKFDPVAYTTAYPDIKAIIKESDYSNAYIHYVTFGQKEGRTLTTNAAVTKKAVASKNTVKNSPTTYQLGIGHGLTVYLSESQYQSCTIKVYKSENGYGAYIDDGLYDTSGQFNSGNCWHYSTIYVNNGNYSESLNSQPKQQEKVTPTPKTSPTPTPAPTPDPVDDDDDEEEITEDDAMAATLFILMIVAELQEQLENGEITQEEYDAAMAQLGL